MKKNISIWIIVAPVLVAASVTIIVYLLTWVCEKLAINDLHRQITFMPIHVLYIVGFANLLTFLPVFIAGILTLGRKGAVGYADQLRTWGIYKYLRNPMYSGLSFSIFGTGIIINSTGVTIAGLIWLLICFFQAKREEAELYKKYDIEYLNYKNITPMFIPDFERLINDFFKRKPVNKKI